MQHDSSIKAFGIHRSINSESIDRNSSKANVRRVDLNGASIEISGDLTLEHCLQKYTVEEHGQEWYCSSCKTNQDDAKKTLKFSDDHLPAVLILTLKRFATRSTSYDTFNHIGGGLAAEKIDAFVDFPLEGLDLSPYCSGTTPSSIKKDALYDLFAVCNHYGRMGFGHYHAYARDWLVDGKLSPNWANFDDDDVRSVSEDHVQSSGAYILFYKRRDFIL